ncbi:unnamed protein product, partial [Amoebophrya sp. A120]|eukprot:GSA120T00019736001.1
MLYNSVVGTVGTAAGGIPQIGLFSRACSPPWRGSSLHLLRQSNSPALPHEKMDPVYTELFHALKSANTAAAGAKALETLHEQTLTIHDFVNNLFVAGRYQQAEKSGTAGDGKHATKHTAVQEIVDDVHGFLNLLGDETADEPCVTIEHFAVIMDNLLHSGTVTSNGQFTLQHQEDHGHMTLFALKSYLKLYLLFKDRIEAAILGQTHAQLQDTVKNLYRVSLPHLAGENSAFAVPRPFQGKRGRNPGVGTVVGLNMKWAEFWHSHAHYKPKSGITSE